MEATDAGVDCRGNDFLYAVIALFILIAVNKNEVDIPMMKINNENYYQIEEVRQIIVSKDNEKVVSLLMEYRQEALRLSQYYQHIADDILWYHAENEQIKIQNPALPVFRKYFKAETVITGKGTSYNTNFHHFLTG